MRAGRPVAARAFFEWVLPLQPPDGLWKQRYFADGELAPSWALHQLDETGTVLWALDQHLAEQFDSGLQSRGLEAATRAFQGVTRLAAETGWPPLTENLWEDQQGAHVYTLAALLAGAHSWHQRARTLADRPAIAVLGHAEQRLQQALADWPVENQTGALARALVGGRGTAGLHPDFTPDASLLGLGVPFEVLKPHDLRLERTVQVIERALTTPSGRVRRYRGDRYMGGNPWPLCGLWLAWHHLRAGRRDAGLRLYRRALGDRTPSGLFPEQVNARTGQARWVVPLPWAHAWFLLVTAADR
jgi:GH15 family glucan-1,4-alpha-glucosidase